MAKFSISLTNKAQKNLDKLPDNIADPIIQHIAELSDNPRPHGYIKLKGRNAYRIRVGNYRIIYEILDQILHIEVIDVGDRKEIYD